MRSPWQSISPLLLLSATTSALSFDCNHIRVDEQSFNLEKLGGPKTVHHAVWASPSIENTTFTIDICNPLKKDKEAKKNKDCPLGTRVCGKVYDKPEDGDEILTKIIPIAGEYTTTNGRKLDPKFTRLKDSASNSDDKEGIVMELHGGKYPNNKDGTPQKAIVEFLCDKEKTGNEGFKDASALADPSLYTAMERRADDDDDAPDIPDQDKGKSLQFKSYKKEGDNMVVRMQWKTKFACEGMADKGGSSSGGWGFFTWFIIILFLLAAAYIIFGSWLNYNRYGARGWDLIPHGDTIRDIPYIVKDWGTGMADRLKGGDTRGGYSAV